MSIISITDALGHRYKRWWGRAHVRGSLKRLSGPPSFDLGDDDVCLIFVGRDVSFFIDDFIQHHRDLGAKYLVYIDNGSRDDSIERVSAYENAIVASCSASFRIYQNYIRAASAKTFVRGGWRLALDPDEIMEYPGFDKISLQDLTRAMSRKGHTGLVAQMLEMVPPGQLKDYDTKTFSEARDTFTTYSLGDITKHEYASDQHPLGFFTKRNILSDPDVKVMYGGLRHTLFGEDCCLTKHVLFKDGPSIRPMWHPHVTTGLKITDMTAVLRHYKFAGDYMQRELNRVNKKLVSHSESQTRLEAIQKQGTLSFDLPAPHIYAGPEELLEADFLIAGPQWRALR